MSIQAASVVDLPFTAAAVPKKGFSDDTEGSWFPTASAAQYYFAIKSKFAKLYSLVNLLRRI